MMPTMTPDTMANPSIAVGTRNSAGRFLIVIDESPQVGSPDGKARYRPAKWNPLAAA